VVGLRIPAIVATLGTLGLYRGVMLLREGDRRRQPVAVVQRYPNGDGAQANGGAHRHVDNPAYFSLQTLAMIFASSQILCLLALGATLVMLTRGGAHRHVDIAGQHHQRRPQRQQAQDL
jgi:ribose/xylose/arabinose/galactoside ABC-type transport system permease subunit